MRKDIDWSFLRLGPNDVLQIDVLGHPELSSGEEGVRVEADGNVYLPTVGPVQLAGMSAGDANEALRLAFERFLLSPVVTATVRDYTSRQYAVLGNVANPGTMPMDRPLNALEALARAGSFTRGADRGSVFLLRPHGETLEVHVFSAATPSSDGLVQVIPGDIIYVRQKGTQDFQEDLLPIMFGVGATTLAVASIASD